MAKIDDLVYTEMPTKAQNIREKAQAVNAQLIAAYNSIEEMHASWYGTRYNELLKEFNKIVPELNVQLEIIVGQIPFDIEVVANNYSTADSVGNVASPNNTAPNKIAEISIPNDVGMRFITSEVETVQDNVTSNFDTAKSLMDEIGTICSEIVWVSEAGETFSSRFQATKTTIVTSLDNVRTAFTNLMNQTKEDIQGAETASTVE